MTRRAASQAAPRGGDGRLPGPAVLLERLMAAVRPEFRVDVFVPSADDPILGAAPCMVPGCGRLQRRRGMCRGHAQQWDRQGRPDIEAFIARASPRTVGRAELVTCTVAGCWWAGRGDGLCSTHRRRWKQAGSPELASWMTTVQVDTTVARATCRLPGCDLWVGGRSGFCPSHNDRWRAWQRRTGGTDVEQFVFYCETRGEERLDFGPLPPQLKLELQYAVQCRVDQRRGGSRPNNLALVLRIAAGSGKTSLLEWPEDQWVKHFLEATPRVHSNANAIPLGFLRFARCRIDDLAHGLGWDSEYDRAVWDLRRVGITNTTARRIRFDRIPQSWLCDLIKRWARWKLTTDVSPVHVARSTVHLSRFAQFLDKPALGVHALADVNREVLERWAAEVQHTENSVRSRRFSIGAVHCFLLAIRQHRWDATLPADAVFHRDDYPRLAEQPPRALPEAVMAQIEHPDNLARFADPAGRLLTLILIRTGLRGGDGRRLAFDCIIRDAQGAPYLRYWNHKMKREGLVPIDDDLADKIATQQAQVLDRWPTPTVLLPRQAANPDGRWPLPNATYRAQLARWLRLCDIRDEHGRAAHVTPHQWRHTFATRLINLDVPQEVVRQLLDHQSHEMTAHYARLHDQTIRKHWENARKVNTAGETVHLDPDGPLADATWTKDRLARAKQSLPNGYCGLPVQQTCPHANACLTCPVFITTPEFLPEHHNQRHRTIKLIATAEAAGQTRVVEMNQHVLGNLDRIITALETDDSHNGARPATADAG